MLGEAVKIRVLRQRHGHSARDQGETVSALLHHQADRRRDRALLSSLTPTQCSEGGKTRTGPHVRPLSRRRDLLCPGSGESSRSRRGCLRGVSQKGAGGTNILKRKIGTGTGRYRSRQKQRQEKCISPFRLRGRDEVAGRESKLEAADGAIVSKVRAWLRRVVAGEHDGHGRAVANNGLRVIGAAAEEVRVVSRSIDDRYSTSGSGGGQVRRRQLHVLQRSLLWKHVWRRVKLNRRSGTRWPRRERNGH